MGQFHRNLVVGSQIQEGLQHLHILWISKIDLLVIQLLDPVVGADDRH